jgi:hypothetical protein
MVASGKTETPLTAVGPKGSGFHAETIVTRSVDEGTIYTDRLSRWDMRVRRFGCGFLTFALLLMPVLSTRADSQREIALSESTITLSGPWKFRTGDDLNWQAPSFDDQGWESVDLTPLPGANDGDVGLTGYVPGWTAKGHPGYDGFAWYRIHVSVLPPAGKTLALLGPWAVDSVYQVYANGKLLGSVGDFSGRTPTAYGNHYPKLIELPSEEAHGGPIVIAIRVWMGPWALAPGHGGIHIAPVIGEQGAITAQYRLQWLKIFEGYAVDAVPALLFVMLAVLVLCLIPVDRSERAYPWLTAALLLSAIQRGNQAFFFWWQIETVQGFVYLIVALVASLNLGAWMMAWRGWFKVDSPAWLPRLVSALTITLMLTQLMSRPWLFHGWPPHSVAIVARNTITYLRVGFLLAFIWIAYAGIRRTPREGCFALPAVMAIGAVLFTSELVAVHVPGIWFPWGVGLSLSECASVVFDVLLFVLLVRRLWSHAWLTASMPA